MKAFMLALMVTVAYALHGLGADPAPINKMIDSEISMIEGEFVSLADAMPADKYEFVPTSGAFKDARTFTQQLKHVAALNFEAAAAVLGQSTPVEVGADENGPPSITGKNAVLQFLKDSFIYAHKAANSMTDQTARELIKNPIGNGLAPRMLIAHIVTWHSFDHYGQAVVYLRMNGIVPPASRPQQ